MASSKQLSFLPDDYLERKAQRRTNIICAILFIIVMGAIGSAFAITDRSIRIVEKQHEEVDRQFTEAAKRIEQVKQMQEKQRTMARQADLTSSLLEKVPRSFILAEITNSLPGGVSLLDFTLDSRRRTTSATTPPPQTAFEQRKAEMAKQRNGGPSPEPQLLDVNMKLTGVAQTDVQVAQFISKLSRSKLLQEVNLLISEEFVHKGDKLRKFQIELILDPNAEIQSTAERPGHTKAVELKGR